MTEWGNEFSLDAVAATVGGTQVEIELVGPHLRVSGHISLGRFHRLTDRVNHSRGYILVQNARLLKRNGDPTPLTVRELYVNQDEVTFVAMPHIVDDDAPPVPSADRPMIEKQARRYVVFTPGHAINGLIHVYREMTTSGLVDSPDPRFIPMTHVSARSLADRRVLSRFDLLLINRTQMTAVAEADQSTGADAPVVELT